MTQPDLMREHPLRRLLQARAARRPRVRPRAGANALVVALSALALTGCAVSVPKSERAAVLAQAERDDLTRSIEERRTSQDPAGDRRYPVDLPRTSETDRVLRAAVPDADTWLAGIFAGNLELARAQSAARQAAIQTESAWSRLLPTLASSLGVGRDMPARGSASGSVNLGLDLDWDPDFWGALSRSAEAEAARAEAERWAARAAARGLWQGSWTAALTWLAALESLELAERSLDVAERTFELVQTRHAAGAVSGVDVALAEGAVLAERARLEARREAAEAALDALVQLEGRPREQHDAERLKRLLGDRLPEVALEIFDGDTAARLERTAAVQVAEWRLRAAQADVESVRASLLPELGVRGGLTARAGQIVGLLEPTALVANLAASLAQTLFDGGRRQASRDLAEERYRDLLTDYRQVVLNTLADAERAELRLATSLREERIERQRYETARRAFELAEIRYRSGLVDALTLLSAQAAELDAADRLVRTRLATLEAWLALHGPLEPVSTSPPGAVTPDTATTPSGPPRANAVATPAAR